MNESYWEAVRIRAQELGGDGCTGVPDFYRPCCDEHDIHYRTHRRLDGTPITKEQADYALRACIRSRSVFGRFSPMAWWRWFGLRYMFSRQSQRAWEAAGEGTPAGRKA